MTTTNNSDYQLPFLEQVHKNLINKIKWNENSSCLHDNCSSCNGTGIRNDGLGPCIN